MAIADKVTIEIDGKEISNFVNFKISQSIGAHHQFEIVFHKDALEQPDNELLAKSVSYIGCPVTIVIEGIDSDTRQRLFFKGIITSLYTTEANGTGQITIKGHSADILLNDNPRCRSFENQTLKQILDDVLKNYQKDMIKSKGSPSNTDLYPFIVQYKENNFNFLNRLAARYGIWFYYDGSNLIFGSPVKDKRNLTLGLDLQNFEISLQMNPLSFSYVFYDYLAKTTITSKSAASDPTTNLNIYGQLVYTESVKKYKDESVFYYGNLNTSETGFNKELDRVVDGDTKAQAITMVMASGSSSALLKLGDSVKIKAKKTGNVKGDIDYGEYVITAVSHYCDSVMNYQNYFAGIPSDAQIPINTDSTRVTPRAETQSAIVKDRHDPKNLGRVRVKFMWQIENQMTPWLRIATHNAGLSKGFFSVPELEDEVLVAFEGGDAEHPFIIGSLYNGKATPQVDGNDVKDFVAIYSKKGSRIFFDESVGADRIVIRNGSSSEGNSIELNLKKNSLTIYSSGDILLKGKNIQLNADENLIFKSSKAVKISGNESVKIDGDTQIHGPQVSIKGDAKISAEGASVSLDGSAMVEIKGGIVKIN